MVNLGEVSFFFSGGFGGGARITRLHIINKALNTKTGNIESMMVLGYEFDSV